MEKDEKKMMAQITAKMATRRLMCQMSKNTVLGRRT